MFISDNMIGTLTVQNINTGSDGFGLEEGRNQSKYTGT